MQDNVKLKFYVDDTISSASGCTKCSNCDYCVRCCDCSRSRMNKSALSGRRIQTGNFLCTHPEWPQPVSITLTPCVDTFLWHPRLSNLCGFCRVQTQVLYRWVEPKICVENVTGAVELPAMGQREPCPPCNPGYYNSNDSTCLPCPPGTHSDGTNGKQAHTRLPWQHICPNHGLFIFMCTHLSVYHVPTILCGLFLLFINQSLGL